MGAEQSSVEQTANSQEPLTFRDKHFALRNKRGNVLMNFIKTAECTAQRKPRHRGQDDGPTITRRGRRRPQNRRNFSCGDMNNSSILSSRSIDDIDSNDSRSDGDFLGNEMDKPSFSKT